MKLAIVFSLVSFMSCVGSTEPDAAVSSPDAEIEDAGADAGELDPGYTIPPEEWIDGGVGGAGGCFGRDLNHFIARFATRSGADPWCAAVLFKRQDGGFTPLFPDFGSPEDFQIADARWSLRCGGIELPNGELNHEYTRPVHDLHGSIELKGFYMNRPRAYDIDGGIRVAYRTYWFSQLAGLVATCAGP